MKKYILAIDQGTTGTTAVLANSDNFEVIAKKNIEFEQLFPKPSWVEHRLNDIMDSIKSAITQVIEIADIDKSHIVSIGITNQRETTCAFTKSGAPLANAIVWQDRRTQDFCMNNSKAYNKYKETTGLPLDPYFSGTKMKWLLENDQDVQKANQNNDLLLSTIDSFILYKLTNHKSFMTDSSNASRTLLMNLETTQWDDNLLSFFGIKKEFLPTIQDSFFKFGVTEGLDYLPDGISINCILGDQQSALFGQSAVNKNDLKCTFGTGAFLLVNTGQDIVHSKNGLLTTVAYRYNNKTTYAIEGSSYIAGAAVQWLRDNLKIIKSSSEVESLANKADILKTEDLFFFPFFTGIGAPYWKSDVKASIVGLTRGTSNEEIARVCLEGIAQSVADSIEAIEKDLNSKINEVKVDGGASLNNLLMQIQSNFLDAKILRPTVIETTSLGVILGSAISNNEISLETLKATKLDKIFNPQVSKYYQQKRSIWKKSLKHF